MIDDEIRNDVNQTYRETTIVRACVARMVGVSCFALMLLPGCSSETTGRSGAGESPKPAETTADESGRGGFPLTVTDGLDRKVTVPERPGRIVSLAPKNTELLFAIGAGDRVVGVTSYCNYPPEAADRTEVGGFAGSSQSIETIVSLRPDLVVAADKIQGVVIEKLQRLGITVVALTAQSLDGLFAETRLLGRAVGRTQKAEQLIETMRNRIEAVRRQVRDIPAGRRVTVFYQVWDDPLMAAGPGSFVGELIDLAGGRNIIADTSEPYPQISEEIVLDRNPDVIVAPSVHAESTSKKQLLEKPGWSEVRAVENDRVYTIDGDLVSRCGPRLVDALEILAARLYPERTAER